MPASLDCFACLRRRSAVVLRSGCMLGREGNCSLGNGNGCGGEGRGRLVGRPDDVRYGSVL